MTDEILSIGSRLGFPYLTFPCCCTDKEGELVGGLDAWNEGEGCWKTRVKRAGQEELRRVLEVLTSPVHTLSEAGDEECQTSRPAGS